MKSSLNYHNRTRRVVSGFAVCCVKPRMSLFTHAAQHIRKWSGMVQVSLGECKQQQYRNNWTHFNIHSFSTHLKIQLSNNRHVSAIQSSALGPLVFPALTNWPGQNRPPEICGRHDCGPELVPPPTLYSPTDLELLELPKMKFNPDKCKVVHVFHKRNLTALPSLSVDQNLLKSRNTVKVLEVTSQNDLLWDGQVDHKLTSANRTTLLFVLPEHVLVSKTQNL